MNHRHHVFLFRVALLIVTGAHPRAAPAAEKGAPEDVRRRVVGEADRLRTKLQTLTRKEGFETVFEPVSQLPLEIDNSGPQRGKDLVLGGPSSNIEFAFAAETGRLTAFFNWYASHQCYGKGALLYDEPTKPKWSKEKAERIAKECVVALLGAVPRNVVVESVEYSHPFMEMPKYYVGEWHVAFTRVDAKEHPFDNDGIIVTISEKHGPIVFGVNMDSEYAEVSTEPISEKRAVSISEGFAKKMLVWKPERSYYLGHELSGEHHARLFIVRPNYILKYASIADAVAAQTRVARLAWEVRHKLVRRDAKSGEAVRTNRELFVWIDATTGDYLGGDFK